MNTAINISQWVLFALLSASMLDLFACIISHAADKTSIQQVKTLNKTMNYSIVAYLLFNIGLFYLCAILIEKGESEMTSSELIMKIATMIHYASVSFVVCALAVTVVTVFCAVAKKGDPVILKKLIGKCIVIAIVFWFIAWLIA